MGHHFAARLLSAEGRAACPANLQSSKFYYPRHKYYLQTVLNKFSSATVTKIPSTQTLNFPLKSIF
jgi:hypothetical protein